MEKILKTRGYVVRFFSGDNYLSFADEEYTTDELTKAILFCRQYNKESGYDGNYVHLYAATKKALVRIL